jgi:hypothetical protein
MFPIRFRSLGIGIAAVVSLVLVLLGMPQNGGGQSLRAGTEVFAVDPNLVLEVSYRQATVQMMAHRWHSGDPFSLIFWEKDQPRPSSCLAGEGFARVLKELTSLRLRRTLDARQEEEYFRKDPLRSWAELRIRDTSALEPFRALVLPLAGPATGALVHFHGSTYLVDIKDQVFELISGGCKTLGVPGEPKASK